MNRPQFDVRNFGKLSDGLLLIAPRSKRRIAERSTTFIVPALLSRKSWSLLLGLGLGLVWGVVPARADLRVGAAKVDITPQQLPVYVNGSMTARKTGIITTRLHARAIVIDDGAERIAIVVVDSCGIPRSLAQDAARLTSQSSQVAANRIVISATHTHTAPSAGGALGTPPDTTYIPLLRKRIADAVVAAEAKLQPAQVGWASGFAPEFTALRRWVRRADRIELDPFGNPTIRANMHAARNRDDVVGPSGPEDASLPMICFRDSQNRIFAILANFSMHYFGHENISADYFGFFCDGLERHLESEFPGVEPMVAMSHGCSGDIWRRDYMQPQPEAEGTISGFAQGLLKVATDGLEKAEFEGASSLAMQQRVLPLRYRVPDSQRLSWANQVVEKMGDRLPETREEIYAREQLFLNEWQDTEITLSAIRIGNIAIATTPNETYALTGLKLKARSPLAKTMVIELANGSDGYIPPPEQHRIGGYNTWAARSAGLEVTAEPKIVAELQALLSEVTAIDPVVDSQKFNERSKIVQSLGPVAYWPLGEMDGLLARDRSGNGHSAVIEPGTLFYLDGDPDFQHAPNQSGYNPALHFVDTRLVWQPETALDESTTIFSFWNGLPNSLKGLHGVLYAVGKNGATTENALQLSIVASDDGPRLSLSAPGAPEATVGQTRLERWRWHRVAITRTQESIQIYLDGSKELSIKTTPNSRVQPTSRANPSFDNHYWAGSVSTVDSADYFQGRLDEVAVFDRVLSDEELSDASK